MSNHGKTYSAKLSVPGKLSDELSYVFTNTVEHHNGSILLFGIFHIKSVHEIYQAFIKETVKNFLDYYHKTAQKELTKNSDGVDPAEFLFENAIQYTNEVITGKLIENEHSEEKRSHFDIKKVHFLVGALSQDQLFFNATGPSMKALLYYPILHKGNFSHYASVNIIESSGESEQDSHRLFSNVISGNVSMKGSSLVFCNQSVVDYISLDQLKQIITTQPTEKIASHFESLLNRANIRHDFSALFINPHHTPSPAVANSHPQTVSSRSMERLNGRERRTDTVLSPAFKDQMLSLLLKLTKSALAILTALLKKSWVFLSSLPYKEWGDTILQSLHHAIKRKTNSVQYQRDSHKKKNTPIIESAKKFFNADKKELITVSVKKCASYVRRELQRITDLLVIRFTALSIVSKSLLALSAVFLLLFVGGLFSVHAKKAGIQKEEQYKARIQSIDQNINLAEGSLIYDDESRAKALLSESESMLKTLHDERSLRIEDEALLRARMKDVLLKMSRIIVIKEPRSLAKLESQIPGLSSLRILSAGGTPVLHTNDAIYTVDTASGKATQLDTQVKLPTISCATAFDKTHYYFCNGDGDKLFVVNTKDTSIKPVSIPFGLEEKKMSAIAFYNARLYTLDTAKGTLYRHPRRGDGFEAGGDWVKEQPSPLTDALGIAIDGTIFVLKSGNTVLQYDSGKPKPFPLPQLEQPISQITKIWTDDEDDVLYLLDAPTKRILAIDKKNFALRAQITSDTFTDLKDFVVNHTKREMTVLNGSEILQFSFDMK
ncbi:MAG: hypothetical protein Q7R79_04995 [bacterium]|nr:hypothetical protein [bacterium]